MTIFKGKQVVIDSSNPSDHSHDTKDIKYDIDVMLWSMRLYKVRRFWRQCFWEAETLQAEQAELIEPFPRLETVAEHSWHVADTVLLLGGHFPSLNLDHCVKLAVIHDKMEILIGDKSPIDRNGTGSSTHAFNEEKRLQKNLLERQAIQIYVAKLRPSAQLEQSNALLEILEGSTEEARFVKAIDKLQALGYVLLKKKSVFDDRHLDFTLRYSKKVIEYFPQLEGHYKELSSRLLTQVARHRNTDLEKLEEKFKIK